MGKQMEVVREYTMVGAYVVSIADASYDIKDSGTIYLSESTQSALQSNGNIIVAKAIDDSLTKYLSLFGGIFLFLIT